MASGIEQCNLSFDSCKSANRIKAILVQHHKITRVKKDNYEPVDIKCDNVELLNDFYHIKYQHHVNDDPNNFQIFYGYVFDNNNVLQCDINDCTSAQQYYRRRNIASNLNIICKIHTYFIHSYETSRLTTDEIHYIEKRLNSIDDEDEDKMNDVKIELEDKILQKKLQFENERAKDKYVTDDHIDIDCVTAAQILTAVNIKFDINELENAFSVQPYHKHNLIDDLCDIFINKGEKKK
eukprot:187760_1